MNLQDFCDKVIHKDRELEMKKYFDEHLTLYHLLSTKFKDLEIELLEDELGCYYILRPNSGDISYMKDFYNNIRVSFFSKVFTVEISLQQDHSVKVRFINKDTV